ncbi:MAG: acyl carrier protein [Jatrophihabitans sp.]
MSVDDRLRDCFALVFPSLDPAEGPGLVRADYDEWDSLASITLLTVVEEEFGVSFDDDTLATFDSYAAISAAVDSAL